MQKDTDRITEGQKLLKQLREEYGRSRSHREVSEPATIISTESIGTESYFEPILPN